MVKMFTSGRKRGSLSLGVFGYAESEFNGSHAVKPMVPTGNDTWNGRGQNILSDISQPLSNINSWFWCLFLQFQHQGIHCCHFRYRPDSHITSRPVFILYIQRSRVRFPTETSFLDYVRWQYFNCNSKGSIKKNTSLKFHLDSFKNNGYTDKWKCV